MWCTCRLGIALFPLLTIKHFILVVESCFIYSKRKKAKQTPRLLFFSILFEYTFSYFFFFRILFTLFFSSSIFISNSSNLFLICSFFSCHEENCLLWTGKERKRWFFFETHHLGFIRMKSISENLYNFSFSLFLVLYFSLLFFSFYSRICYEILMKIILRKYVLRNEGFYFRSIKKTRKGRRKEHKIDRTACWIRSFFFGTVLLFAIYYMSWPHFLLASHICPVFREWLKAFSFIQNVHIGAYFFRTL